MSTRHAAPDNKAIYDEHWDNWFDQKVYGPASRWLRWLIRLNLEQLPSDAIHRALDVGCGQGTTTAMIAELLPSADVLGIDFSETGIAAARRAYVARNLGFEVDPQSDRLHPAAFELVTCFEVLEHVEDWEALLQRISTASRRYVMLSFPTGRMRAFEPGVGHVRNFSRGEVEAFMQREGFAVRNVYYAGFPFYSPLYRDFCNLMDAGNSGFAAGRYDWRQRAVSAFLFGLFRFFSLKRVGDQFCGLFERR